MASEACVPSRDFVAPLAPHAGDGVFPPLSCTLSPSIPTWNAEVSVDQLALATFLSGREPFLKETSVYGRRALMDAAPGLPAGGSVVRRIHNQYDNRITVVRGEGWTAVVAHRPRLGRLDVTVTARSEALADSVSEEVIEGIPPDPPFAPETISLDLWRWRPSSSSPSKLRRQITGAHWPEIAENYAPTVRAQLARLSAMAVPSCRDGRLIVWHGEAGTGKTTAVRSLARSWATWAAMHYITDPERFFAEADYMYEVLVADQAQRDRSWLLLVIEDAGELLARDAAGHSGAALGRLLNLSDGILGQGAEVITLVTTNQERQHLDPAVIRPGRCLADVRFDRFTRAEATNWLGRAEGIPNEGITLAELYRLRGDMQAIGNQRDAGGAGFYL